MFFASNLKFLRKRRGFTQDELAYELSIKRSIIGSYEEGRAHPPYNKLAEIAQYFHVAIDLCLGSCPPPWFVSARTKREIR